MALLCSYSVSDVEYNRYSVKLELQADFYAGVWAHYVQEMDTILEKGDIEEALNAANAIGDDKLQKQTKGYIVPDAFTHGTSAQRMYWFKKGFDTGDISQGNTFSDVSLKKMNNDERKNLFRPPAKAIFAANK